MDARKDYDKLAEIIEKDGSEYYKFYTPQNARKFIYPFGNWWIQEQD